MERGLRRSARLGVGACRVQPVLEDVEIKAAQIFRTKILDCLHGRLEFEFLVMCQHFSLQFVGQYQRVAVNFQPLRCWQRIVGGIEISCVGQQEAQRIANAPVTFDDAFQNFIRDG